LQDARNQHEYDTLIKLGRKTDQVLADLERGERDSVRTALTELQKTIALRTVQVSTGDKEGWRVADAIEPERAFFETEFEEQIEQARKATARTTTSRKRPFTAIASPQSQQPGLAPMPMVAPSFQRQQPFPQRTPGPTRPRGGCYYCQGPHYARDCPMRAGHTTAFQQQPAHQQQQQQQPAARI